MIFYDVSDCRSWYEKAADRGHAEAQLNFANMLLLGKIVESRN
jgi:TPR repeat protein